MLNAIVDLSHYNSVSSFVDAKNSGILGVIHKATEGVGGVDAKYQLHRQAAQDAGLLWGAYHFGVNADAGSQVEHFLGVVKPEKSDLLVLDFEPNGRAGTMTIGQAEEFVTLVNEKTGRFPGVYSGQSFINEVMENRSDSPLAECFLWIARYSSQPPKVPPAWDNFTLWQYSDGSIGPEPHEVPGIGRCDRDKFNGDEDGLNRLWGVD